MSKFTLLGKEITFSKAEDNFCNLQFILWKELDDAKAAYDLWYKSQGSIVDVINNCESFFKEIIELKVLTHLYDNLAKEYQLYGISKSEYVRVCSDISALTPICENAIEIYNDIVEQLQEEIEERAYNEELRRAGQISFGIGDTLKNAASNAAHGIAKSSGNASSREHANKKKAELFNEVKEPLWDALKDSIVTTVSNHEDFVNKKAPDSIISCFDREISNAYLDNAKSIEEKREEFIIEAFRKCPWNYNVHAYVFNTYPAERRNIIGIANHYDISLTKEIDAVLRSEYVGNAKTDEAEALKVKGKIKKLMAEWGVEKSVVIDEIEIDCLERLTADYSTATEERCNELKQQLEQYEAHTDNKKTYFEKIQSRIEEIWAKEDGEIFDNYLMQANILSSKVVEEGKAYIKEKGRTAESEKYYKAFDTCTPSNIRKARLFHALNKTTVSKWVFKLFGIALIAFGWIYAAFVEELTFVDTLPLLVGIVYQIFYMYIKKKWTIITIKGTVVNPIITLSHKDFKAKYSCTVKDSNTSQK